MDALLAALIEDHSHIERLLNCLDSEVYRLEDPDAEPDLSRILEALDYMQAYPETFHHPLEDRLFARLRQRVTDVQLLKMLDVIESQHQMMERITLRLQESFMGLANDLDISRHELIDQYREYSMLQREHLNCENQYVFPVLADYLLVMDYDDIREALLAAEDPLFGGAAAERQLRGYFHELYDYVMSSEEDRARFPIYD